MMGGGSGNGSEVAAAQAPSSQYPNEPSGPCAWEIKQFLQCAQDQSDLSLCEGFNEAIRQCKTQNSKKEIYTIHNLLYFFNLSILISNCFFSFFSGI